MSCIASSISLNRSSLRAWSVRRAVFSSSCNRSVSAIRTISGAMDDSVLRIAMNAFVILLLASMAMSLFRTLASMIMPCSVKAYGLFRTPIFAYCSRLEVAICDLQSFSSSFVSWNMKLSGKRLAVRADHRNGAFARRLPVHDGFTVLTQCSQGFVNIGKQHN